MICDEQPADWDQVREVVNGEGNLQLAQDTGSPFHKVYELQLCILSMLDYKSVDHMGKNIVEERQRLMMAVDKLLSETTQMTLLRWQLHPRLFTASKSHKPLLHLFHQLHELRVRQTIGRSIYTIVMYVFICIHFYPLFGVKS